MLSVRFPVGDRFEFDEFTLDVADACLRHRQEAIHLTPKALNLLHFLLRQHGRLVTKEQIFAAVWPAVVVGESAIFACVRELRQALGDDAKAPRYIETVHRLGYRFASAVVVREIPSATAHDAEPAGNLEQRPADPPVPAGRVSAWWRRNRLVLALTAAAVVAGGVAVSVVLWDAYLSPAARESRLALPANPSIAVLPFDNMSNDPEQDYFADGITEDLITDLSQLRGLFVIDRHSTFAYKQQAAGARRIARELGVRYILEGSVRRSGDQLRVTAQLIDTSSGDHLWAARFDRTLAEIFALQDEIRREIIAALDVRLSEGEQSQVWRNTARNPQAYVLFLQARELYLRFEQGAIEKSVRLFERAIELDERFAAAYAMLGWCYETLPLWAESPRRQQELQARAFELAQQALELDPNLPVARSLLAALYLWRGDSDQAYREGKRAVELSPSSAKALAVQSVYASSVGRYEEALAAIDKATRLNPHPPHWYLFVQGRAYTFNERYADAIRVLEECAARLPDYLNCYYESIIALMELGREEQARRAAREVLRINPNFSKASRLEWLDDPAVRARHEALLSRAGLSN